MNCLTNVLGRKNAARGFTMIELLIAIAIIGILASLALTSFTIYREDAEYSKAESDLRNSRTAMEAGSQDLPDGYSLALTYSDITGGVLANPLSEVMPEGASSRDVRLGASYESCAGGAPGDLNQFIIASSCKANRSISYSRFCNGLEVIIPELPFGCV